MKATYKTILLAVLCLFCCHCATAQQPQPPDTLYGPDVRYYRNCTWLDTTWHMVSIDHFAFSHPVQHDITIDYYFNEFQRMIYPFSLDRPLKIIGIAGAMRLFTYGSSLNYADTHADTTIRDAIRESYLAYDRTEYFELYGTRVYDSTGMAIQESDSLMLLGSVSFLLTDSSRFISIPINNLGINLTTPIIERYFQKGVWMDTNFYIGHTMFHRDALCSETSNDVWYTRVAPFYYQLTTLGADGYFHIHPYSWYDPDSCFLTYYGWSESNFNVLFQGRTSETNPYEPWTESWPDTNSFCVNAYLPILFPIVDTMGMNIIPGEPDSNNLVCDTVEGFRLLDQQGNAAAFAWTDDNQPEVWQLSWGEEGIAPEEGTMLNVYNNVKSITGLQDSVVYTAFVRARCNDTLFSEWSAPLRFWKGMSDTVSLLPHNTVEQLTYLYPNPAENSVTVACSFAMSLVELFALDGTKLLSQPANGIMTQIDLTPFPKSTYMLRITTPAGTAIKKLIRR